MVPYDEVTLPFLPDQLKQDNWLPLITSDDIDALMRYFCGFSDSLVTAHESWGETYVDEEPCIVYPSGAPQADQHALITFQRQAAEQFSVKLLLTGVTDFRLRGRSEKFDGLINFMKINTNTPKNHRIEAQSFLNGPTIIAASATALYWYPMPR